MKKHTALNQYISMFLLNCISADSLISYKKEVKKQKHKTGLQLLYKGIPHDVLQISLHKGRFYLAYIETADEYVLCGYHLNNDDVDDEGNFKFNFGRTHNDKAKIHILINNEIKL